MRSAVVAAWAASLVGWAAACGPAATHARKKLTAAEIVQQSTPAIVRIQTDLAGQEGAHGVGTGFIVAADGRIATNLHVIHGSKAVSVTLLDGTTLPVHEVIAVDPDRDLAIIQVNRSGLPVLRLGDSEKVDAGDPVIAIGNPLGVLDYTVSDGLISSIRMLENTTKVLQISAPISRGSSGGPLFNSYGEVIGVATFISLQGQNLNFGIPSNYLRPLMAARSGMTLEQLEARLPATPHVGEPAIERKVPHHEMAILDGCKDTSIVEVVRVITEAIDNGAPIYNQGNHEACYRIYEGAARKLRDDLKACDGIKGALDAGLKRAEGEISYTEKAWALRDTFDGLLDVVMRKARDAK
ncbi:MAG TPA: trypsin-like peptidase domain-containing protein [Kofleriaceae bacterium]|nr:trypsin-like peptidase domain-containing protein [Kofleriaceae bacterium]